MGRFLTEIRLTGKGKVGGRTGNIYLQGKVSAYENIGTMSRNNHGKTHNEVLCSRSIWKEGRPKLAKQAEK